MRIRSTKPEFWRSETIAELDWDTRLILKGIEAYVDDNGVGKDSVILICADVFPHDLARDPETVARVSRGLEALCTAQILVRYTMAGERLLYVRRWKSLQRVDKPNKGRHPRPDGTIEYAEAVDETVGAGQGDSIPVDPWDSGDYRETLANDSGDSRETPAPGTEEQGNRGTGEQKEKRAPAKPDAAKPKAIEQAVTEQAYERVGKALNFMAVRQIAKWAIHDRGAEPRTVEDAIVSIYQMGKPITRQVMGQFLDGHFHSTANGISRADQKVQGYLDMGARLTRHSDEPKEITR